MLEGFLHFWAVVGQAFLQLMSKVDPTEVFKYAVGGLVAALTFVWRESIGRAQARREELRASVVSSALAWSREAVDMMTAGVTWLREASQGRPPPDSQRLDLVAKLSAHVDAGRLFFPNHSSDLPWPSWKLRLPANWGFRDPLLDAVLLVHHELDNYNAPNNDLAKASSNANEVRRYFVSEIQQWVDPYSLGLGRVKEIKRSRHAKKTEMDWKLMKELVENYDLRQGWIGAFWAEEPLTRSELKRNIREKIEPVIRQRPPGH